MSESKRAARLAGMRLLQVTGTLEPTYGGPPVVVENLTRSMTELGHSVDVVTLDPPSAHWIDRAQHHIIALGPSAGRYRYSGRLRSWLRANAGAYDAIVVHGIWQYQSIATRNACRRGSLRYFVFVHGALDPWFRKRYPIKHLKKWLYWRLWEHKALRDARAVLFTTDKERFLARSSFTPYEMAESVVDIGVQDPGPDNLPQRQAFLSMFPELERKRILLFLGRIHPKKGCDVLIEAFAHVAESDPDLQLVIGGPDEGGTRDGLESLSRRLGVHHRITWTGMLTGDAKWGAFRTAEAFVLTSHSENFGLVVPEALACGLPVLITDKVNLWSEVDTAGAGFVESDTVDGAHRLLSRWLAIDPAEQQKMRWRARECFLQKFDSRAVAPLFVEFLSAAAGSTDLR